MRYIYIITYANILCGTMTLNNSLRCRNHLGELVEMLPLFTNAHDKGAV